MPAYRKYKGSKGRRAASTIGLVFILLLVAALGYYTYLHVEFKEDGTVSLNRPSWLARATPVPEGYVPPPASETDISPSPEESESPSPTKPSPSPIIPIDYSATRGVFVPMAMLTNVDALETIKLQTISKAMNTIVIDWKNKSGDVATLEAVTAAKKTLGTQYKYIARISCFRDDYQAKNMPTWGIKHESGAGVNWLDSEGRWVNPFVEEVKQYVLDLIKSASDAGFDEILLDDVTFPYYGSLSKIDYGIYANLSHNDAINRFLSSVTELNLNTLVTAVVHESIISTGANSTSGQDLKSFKAAFSVLYVYDPIPAAAKEPPFKPIYTFTQEKSLNTKIDSAYYGFILFNPDGVYPFAR